jgi:glutamate-1-semialdehyde 2,1-aminomutase
MHARATHDSRAGGVDSHAAALHERAARWVPAGTHSNSRVRNPHALYATRAEGAHLWDADGRRWLDCTMGNGSVMLGHQHPKVAEAVRGALANGVTTGHETEDAVAAVELLAELVPDCGMIRFANTGTEAVMHAIAIARHATGRSRIAKAEASYHGWADPVWVSTWPSPDVFGTPDRPNSVPGSAGLGPDAEQTLVLPFNDPDAAEKLIDAYADELAAVIVEPALIDIGYVPASTEYLHRLRQATERAGAVLVFDELLTGFRIARGGAREAYGVRADLSTFGKAMANGWPVAAVEGRAELLAHTDPQRGGAVGWIGTYNSHAPAMAATRAALETIRDDGVLDRLDALTDRLARGFGELAAQQGIPAVLAGAGGHFQPYFCPTAPYDYRSALETNTDRYTTFNATCRQNHVLVAEKPLLHCALSAAHTEKDVDMVLETAAESFATMQDAP